MNLSLSHSLSHTLSLSLSLTHSHTHTHTLSLSLSLQTQGAMEKVQEQREEIQKMVDAILVRQGSPSFIHQLRSLLEQIEAFLRRIHVSSTPYPILHISYLKLHTPYSTLHTPYSTPHTPYSTANTIILHILTTHTPCCCYRCSIQSYPILSYCHTLIPPFQLTEEVLQQKAQWPAQLVRPYPLPNIAINLSLSLSVFIVVSHHLAVGQYTHHSIDMYW